MITRYFSVFFLLREVILEYLNDWNWSFLKSGPKFKKISCRLSNWNFPKMFWPVSLPHRHTHTQDDVCVSSGWFRSIPHPNKQSCYFAFAKVQCFGNISFEKRRESFVLVPTVCLSVGWFVGIIELKGGCNRWQTQSNHKESNVLCLGSLYTSHLCNV